MPLAVSTVILRGPHSQTRNLSMKSRGSGPHAWELGRKGSPGGRVEDANLDQGWRWPWGRCFQSGW